MFTTCALLTVECCGPRERNTRLVKRAADLTVKITDDSTAQMFSTLCAARDSEQELVGASEGDSLRGCAAASPPPPPHLAHLALADGKQPETRVTIEPTTPTTGTFVDEFVRSNADGGATRQKSASLVADAGLIFDQFADGGDLLDQKQLTSAMRAAGGPTSRAQARPLPSRTVVCVGRRPPARVPHPRIGAGGPRFERTGAPSCRTRRARRRRTSERAACAVPASNERGSRGFAPEPPRGRAAAVVCGRRSVGARAGGRVRHERRRADLARGVRGNRRVERPHPLRGEPRRCGND